jgi:N-acetyl-gamma-glutamyl-phosphate reductase
MRSNNLRVYKPLTHTHAPEIRETLIRAGATTLQVNFVPVAAPLTRGILATSLCSLPADVTSKEVAQAFSSSYGHEPFVVMPEGRLPEVVAVLRSNRIEVGFAIGEADAAGCRTITCVSALDNLVKGGAGQMIQNANLMCGFEDTTALDDTAPFP